MPGPLIWHAFIQSLEHHALSSTWAPVTLPKECLTRDRIALESRMKGMGVQVVFPYLLASDGMDISCGLTGSIRCKEKYSFFKWCSIYWVSDT